MKRLAILLHTSALALGGLLLAQPSLASKPVLPQVTGHVTALASNEVIVVDGRRYPIAVTSGAYKTMSHIHVGDAVALIFDGPVNSSAAHVTAIQLGE